MPSYTVKLNRRELDIQVKHALGKSEYVKQLALKQFQPFFYQAKQNLMRAFDRHPVTQEIKAGPLASNISETLDGYGNLFSFIGFPAGSSPTEDLRQLFLDAVDYRQQKYENGAWYFVVTAPTRAEILAVTQMPWEQGNSWAEGIERGISGLSFYMYKKWDGGRSQHGFQLPYENMEDATFQPRKYLSEILAKFRERMNNK